MELSRPEQYQFTLIGSAEEAEVARTAVTLPASQSAIEDLDRAKANENLQRTLPPVSEPWMVNLSAIELIALHRATRRLQYKPEHSEDMRRGAAVFTKDIVTKAEGLKYYLA